MKIVGDDSKWFVLFTDGRPSLCLRGLALECGYRVGELSDALGHSERYVHEVFGRDVGVPPKRWLRQERMVVAERMLREGLRPGEVGDKLGFAHGTGFRREFRQAYGMPPVDYSRRLLIRE